MTSKAPAGEKIVLRNQILQVPDQPVLPFIEGDGTGPDIWRASQAVFDAAVKKAYGGKRKAAWLEVYAGETAFKKFNNWLPDETVEAFNNYLVGIKGPLTTPGSGSGEREMCGRVASWVTLYSASWLPTPYWS